MKVVVSWTGGKDSCLALSLLQLLQNSHAAHTADKKDERFSKLPLAPCLPDGERSWEVMGLVTFAPKGVCAVFEDRVENGEYGCQLSIFLFSLSALFVLHTSFAEW